VQWGESSGKRGTASPRGCYRSSGRGLQSCVLRYGTRCSRLKRKRGTASLLSGYRSAERGLLRACSMMSAAVLGSAHAHTPVCLYVGCAISKVPKQQQHPGLPNTNCYSFRSLPSSSDVCASISSCSCRPLRKHNILLSTVGTTSAPSRNFFISHVLVSCVPRFDVLWTDVSRLA